MLNGRVNIIVCCVPIGKILVDISPCPNAYMHPNMCIGLSFFVCFGRAKYVFAGLCPLLV